MARDSVTVRGDHLRALRQKWNLTQSQLAERVSRLSPIPLSRSYVSDLEAGRKNPRRHVVVQLAGILRVEPEELILDSTPPTD